ncbi:MAG TPA: thermonuclease family protein [Allosphingosinicella sp.]|nr:thermonuclease family protein [Allosphingosinicella sp.]
MRRRSLLLLVPVVVAAGLALAGRGPAPSELSPVPPAKAERGGKRIGGNPAGAVRIVDGDTLRIGDARIRLHGIDAPERAQSCSDADGRRYRCGEEASAALARLIGDGRPDCAERDRDSYGRSVAICTVGGRDLNRAMVAGGWALAYIRYSRDYEADEAAARRARRGVWQGSFERPDQYRAARRGSRR